MGVYKIRKSKNRSTPYAGGRRTSTRAGVGSSNSVRSMKLARVSPAGVAESISPPSKEAFLSHVMEGICPYCGLGPYELLASHTHSVHGVDRFELRERAGLTRHARITPDDFFQRKSEQIKKQIAEGKRKMPIPTKSKGKKRVFSQAGLRVQREKLNLLRSDPDLQAEINKKAMNALAVKVAKEMEPIYRQVMEVYEQVLRDRGMRYGAIRETADRLGWIAGTTQRRIVAAQKAGFGSQEQVPWHVPSRVVETEERTCVVCEKQFTVTRSSGWKNITCGTECGRKYAGTRNKKPPRTAVCKICNTEFTYIRQGTSPRVLCGARECQAEVTRRAATGREVSDETRRKLSEAAKRRKR